MMLATVWSSPCFFAHQLVFTRVILLQQFKQSALYFCFAISFKFMPPLLIGQNLGSHVRTPSSGMELQARRRAKSGERRSILSHHGMTIKTQTRTKLNYQVAKNRNSQMKKLISRSFLLCLAGLRYILLFHPCTISFFCRIFKQFNI